MFSLPTAAREAFMHAQFLVPKSLEQQLLGVPEGHPTGEGWIRRVLKWKLLKICASSIGKSQL